jgi:hypothetical protein
MTMNLSGSSAFWSKTMLYVTRKLQEIKEERKEKEKKKGKGFKFIEHGSYKVTDGI